MRSQIERKLAEWRTKKAEEVSKIAIASESRKRAIERLGVEQKSRALIGIEKEIQWLEVAMDYLNEAEKPGLLPKEMNGQFEAAMRVANPAGRAAHEGDKRKSNKERTEKANMARRQSEKSTKLENAILAEIRENGWHPTKGEKFAGRINSAVRQRLGVTDGKWPTDHNIRDIVTALLEDRRLTR